MLVCRSESCSSVGWFEGCGDTAVGSRRLSSDRRGGGGYNRGERKVEAQWEKKIQE